MKENVIKLHDKKFKVMIPAAKIEEAVAAVAAKINEDYREKRNPLFLGVLNGSRPAEEDRFQLRNIVRETLFVLRYLLVGGCQVSDRTGQQHRRPGRDYRRGHCGYGRQHRTHGRGVEDEEARQYPRVYAFLQTESIPAPDSDRLSGHAHRQRVYRGIRAGLRPVGPELQGCLRGDRIVR